MSVFRSACVLAVLLSTGCASLPAERGYAETSALVAARVGVAPDARRWATPDPAPIPREPLTAERALALALGHSPRIRQTYARLGLGRAELEEARRIANPEFGFARLRPAGGGSPKITRSLSAGVADLLLLPARKRFARAELARLQNDIAAQLLELSVEVETAWYEAVGARQVADMRELVASASQASADLAQRFFDAGNITRLQLEQERAAAAQARIEATRAAAQSLRTRGALAGLVGLPADPSWSLASQLPAPPETVLDADALTARALEQRLDLVAARQAVAQHEDMLGVTRRWRWLGAVEVGFEQEREGEDGVAQGPTLSLELPIFNQGQGATAKAGAELIQARAELDALALSIGNDARLGVQSLEVARAVAEAYRRTLIPAREAIVARTQEQVNYMLMGVFELILAKREEYDAYQEYLEAVRDYWVARTQLRGVVGGALPDDGADLTPTVGVEAVLPPAQEAMDHAHHGQPPEDPHAGHRQAVPASSDPHAGHRMPSDPDDPHAGHAMPEPPAERPVQAPAVEPPEDEPAQHDHEHEHDHDHGDTP